MKKPISIGSPQFKRLQAKWYRILDRKGHKDVERYQDLNLFPATTMPHGHGPFLFDTDTDELDEDYIRLEDTDQAGYWRQVGRYASQMSPKDKRYDVIMAFSQCGSISETAQECGIGFYKARHIIRTWLSKNGLHQYLRSRGPDEEPAPPPGPVRHLSKSEIKRLNYTAPKKKGK
jgi:hypothetical protein